MAFTEVEFGLRPPVALGILEIRVSQSPLGLAPTVLRDNEKFPSAYLINNR